MKTLSIVTSLYSSAPYIDEFYKRTLKCLSCLPLKYEFIFVNDASPDDSATRVLNLRKSDEQVHLIDLSRNFGQQRAMMAGLSEASGDYIFTIDVDLEERPEFLLELYQALTEENLDVVYGVMKKRQGGIIKKHLGSLFHWLLNQFSYIPIPKNVLWSRLMTRQYAQCVTSLKEEHLYFGGLFQVAGFKQKPIYLEKTYKGSTTYTTFKKFLVAYDALFSFTSAPLMMICFLGGAIVCFSLLYALFTLIQYTFFGLGVPGWTTIVLFQSLMFGFVIFTQGIIGIYVGKTFMQSKNRPLYFIKDSTLTKHIRQLKEVADGPKLATAQMDL